MSNENLLRLLTIFDSSEEAEALINVLRGAGHIVRDIKAEDEEDIVAAIEENPIDLAISKLKLGLIDARKALATISKTGRDIPLIVITPHTAEAQALPVLQAGARDVVAINDTERLKHIVKREMADLTARRAHRRAEQMLHETEKRARSLIDSSRDAIAYVHDGMHIYANEAYLRMFGNESLDDIEGMPIMDMIISEDHTKLKEFLRNYAKGKDKDSSLDLTGQGADGKQFKMTMEFSPASMEGEACTQIIIRDKAMSKELEQKLNAMNQQDLLTGLYNRNYFMEQLDKLIRLAIEGKTRATLLYIMLDKYDTIRNEIGVAAGDMLLTDVAKMLNGKLAKLGVLARFAGPIFTLLIDDADAKKAGKAAEAICKVIQDHISDVGQVTATTTASIGISLINETTPNGQDCITRAEKGAQQAHAQGGNRSHTYNPAIEDMAEQEQAMHWAQKIKAALQKNQFRLVFQPIVSLHGEPGAHYDVLVRMLDDNGGVISPSSFIPAAEKTSLMQFIDRWVISNSISLLLKRQKEGLETRFFIKLSSGSLLDAEFLQWLRERISTTRVNAENLVFEMSEDMALNHLKQAKVVVTGLKELNCRSALENFGKEQNTMQSIKHLPVNYIKVHMDLIHNLAQSMENQEKVKNIAEQAGQQNIQTIAAFVEDANSLAVLWQCSVNFIQGHFLQQPDEGLNYDFEESF